MNLKGVVFLIVPEYEQISEEEELFRMQEAIRMAKEKSRIMKKTTCEYDEEKGVAYLLFPDGHREYPLSENNPSHSSTKI